MANGYEKPNYTQLPNALLDHHLPQMKESELKVVLAIARATFGWHKESVKLSLSQLMEKTGMTRQGVVNGAQAGIERGVIVREPDGQGFIYSLIINDELVNEIDQSTKLTSQRNRPELVNEIDQGSQRNRLEVVNNVDQLPPTLKKVKERTTKKGKKTARAPQPDPTPIVADLNDPRIILEDPPPARRPGYSQQASRPREVNEGQANPGQLVKRGTGEDAYWIFREYTSRSMTSHQIDAIRETVTDLVKWRAICERWCELYGDSWYKFGHLDWYRNGIPGEKGTHHGQQQGNGVHRADSQAGQRPHYANYEPAEYDEERAAELNGWA